MLLMASKARIGFLPEFIFIKLALRARPDNLRAGGVEPYPLVVLRSDPS
jgi:hypothetical protein